MKGTRLLGNNRNLKVLLLALVAIVATGLALGGYAARSLRTLDLSSVNQRFSIRGTQKPASNVVIVAIDDQSIATINKQWPFPVRPKRGYSIASAPGSPRSLRLTWRSRTPAPSGRRTTWPC